jgi:hypothetical protein
MHPNVIAPPVGRHVCRPPDRPRMVRRPMPAAWSGGKPGEKTMVQFPVPALPGSLWRCDDCDTWWYSYVVVHRGPGYQPNGIGWARVTRWPWHRKYRRRIAEHQAADAAALVAAWPGELPESRQQPEVEESPPPMPPPGGAVPRREKRYGGYTPGKNSSDLKSPIGLRSPPPSRPK